MIQMKRKLNAIILFVFCGFPSPVDAQTDSIYGAYQVCDFACQTIRINPDFTFEYRLDGDLYNDERHRGTWRFVNKTNIHATIGKDHSPPNVTEKISDLPDHFRVSVIDSFGAAVNGAEISGLSDGVAFKIITDDNGVGKIPECQQFEIEILSYRGVHKVEDQKADEFLVTLTVAQIAHWALDQIWLVEGKRLYIMLEDGTVNRDFWLEKLSRSKERKIFR